MEVEVEEVEEVEEEEQEESVQTWDVHCVGVSSQALYFQTHTKPGRFIAVLWCALSSNLCSPFFTHRLKLQPVSLRPHTYTVSLWLETVSRLPDVNTSRKDVRELINNTLFLLLEPQRPWADRAQRFPWYLATLPLSVVYSYSYDPAELLQWKNSPKRYWDDFRRAYHDRLTQARSLLKLPDTVSVNELFGVLERCADLKHAAPYLRHRLLEMDDLFTVACHNDELQIPLDRLVITVVQDLANLHRQMHRLARQRLISGSVHPYNDLAKLMRTTLAQKVPMLLTHHFPQPAPHNPAIRLQLLRHVIVPTLMHAMECRAQETLDSCFPVTFESLRWHFCSLLGLSTERSDAQAMLPFDHSLEAPVDSVTHFRPHHLQEVLQQMRGVSRPLHWQCALESDKLISHLYTPLFVIHAQPEELKRERYLRDELWRHPKWQRHYTLLLPPDTVQWDVPRWRREYEQMDDIERSFYETRLVLAQFSPVEMLQGCDMCAVYQLLHTDFHATAVILPPRSHSWTQLRLQRYFVEHVPNITLEQLATQTFRTLTEETLRDTLVVLEAHMYSNAEMQSLMNWLEVSRTHYSRCVMLGAYDTHPLHCVGHAFVDLAQWHDRAAVRQASFNNTLHSTQFRALVQEALPRVHRVTALSGLPSLVRRLATGATWITLYLIESLWPSEKRFAKQTALHISVTDYGCLDSAFRAACQLRIDSVALNGLAMCAADDTNGQRCLFLVDCAFLQKLTRNELNHLFTEQRCLIVLDTSLDGKRDHQFQWLVKQTEEKKWPNLRHTLPFMTHETVCTV